MTSLTPEQRSAIFDHHGRSIMLDYLAGSPDGGHAPPQPSPRQANDVVGIVGAGIGGLYTALMLQSLDIPFEIIEASDRVGGRLFTYHFEGGGKYDYYDVGAMRFPLPPQDDKGNYRPGVMKRLGDLFNYLDMGDKLLAYYFTSAKKPGFQYFNGVRTRLGTPGVHFGADKLGIPDDLIQIGVSGIVGDVTGPFANLLLKDLAAGSKSGWDVMMRNDVYSTRAYMSFKYIPSATFGLAPEHLRTREINWCETFDKSSGWYDRALSETVLEEIAFGANQQVDWKCIDGGSSVLPETIATYLKDKLKKDPIVRNASVTAIGQVDPHDANSPMVVSVHGQQPRQYSHVISTLPLPVLRTIDLSGSNLDIVQTNALRQLQYGPSIKVGIRFTEPWWTTGKDMHGEPFDIVGGQSYTDLPIRTVVYPSYGSQDGATPSNTLIASYCWTNDAERLGSLIGTGAPTYDAQLEKLVLDNLALVHNVTYEYLKSRLVKVFAWDWNHDPLTMGAFAFFGPGNFQDMYTSMSRPAANNKLHFAGEALSVRHAWVVGALDSAWRAVYNYLYLTDREKIPEFTKIWGKNAEWFEEPTLTRGPAHLPKEGGRPSLLEKYLSRTHSVRTR